MYLSTRNKKSHNKAVKLINLLENGTVEEKTIIQIDKDVLRTPPASIFKFTLK